MEWLNMTPEASLDNSFQLKVVVNMIHNRVRKETLPFNLWEQKVHLLQQEIELVKALEKFAYLRKPSLRDVTRLIIVYGEHANELLATMQRATMAASNNYDAQYLNSVECQKNLKLCILSTIKKRCAPKIYEIVKNRNNVIAALIVEVYDTREEAEAQLYNIYLNLIGDEK